MPWGTLGKAVSLAYCSFGFQSCPAPPHSPAFCIDLTRPWYDQVLDSTKNFMNNSRTSLGRVSPRTCLA